MKKIESYTIQTLTYKHTQDQIHGNDPVYESALNIVKNKINEIKKLKQFDASSGGLYDTVTEIEKAIKTIDDIKTGKIDNELIENYIRYYIQSEVKELNEIIDEIEKDQ